MKDTLRKKHVQGDSTADVTSPSSESGSTNPWAEAQSVFNTEPISRQTSKTSQSPGPPQMSQAPRSPAPASSVKTNATDPAPMDVQSLSPAKSPVTATMDSQAATQPKAKGHKKTVSKARHKFELVEDLKPTAPKDPAPATEEPTPDTSKPPKSALKRKSQLANAASKLTFSTVTTTLNLEPITTKPPRSAVQNPFTATHRPRKSSSSQAPAPIGPAFTSNPTRFTAPQLTADSLSSKVIVLTHGASPSGASIVRLLHSAGARVIFGDANPDAARRLIKSLGPVHLVHYQKCDTRRYDDVLDLFKLAVVIYGRVDHAISGVGEDGGNGGTVGEAEGGWFERAAKPGLEGVQREPGGQALGETLGAVVLFAHIALAYLRYTTRGKGKRDSVSAGRDWDRSLTLLTSVASFRETPGLPVYQVAQHGVLGLVRSLRLGVDPEREGVRVNAVVTGMMIARASGGAGGRMSVKLPGDGPEDVGRAVVGVVMAGNMDGVGGIWYERASDKGDSDGKMHGRAVYVVGSDAWDIEEGLRRSAQVWLGSKPSDALGRAQDGIGRDSQWILDL